MVQKLESKNLPRFILCDLDHAATHATNDTTPRTGNLTPRYRIQSLPFVSHEVLYDFWYRYEKSKRSPMGVSGGTSGIAIHYVRFDYESLLYVALWCCFKCENPPHPDFKRIVEGQINDWECGTYRKLFNQKASLLTRITGPGSLEEVPMTPLFEPWRPWLAAWIDVVLPADILLQRYGYQAGPEPAARVVGPVALDRETVNGHWTRDTILIALRNAELNPLPQ